MRRELSATSAAVVVAPKLNRNAPEITSSTSPIAISAGDGSLDPLAQARVDAGPDQVLLGNLNPVALLRDSPAQAVSAAAAECHRQAGARFIVGAGCEVPRGTPRENLTALCDFARG